MPVVEDLFRYGGLKGGSKGKIEGLVGISSGDFGVEVGRETDDLI